MKKSLHLQSAIEKTPEAFHDRLTHIFETLPDMQAKKHAPIPIRRVLLCTALFLMLMGSTAVGTRFFDVAWFWTNRIAEPPVLKNDSWSVSSIAYTGRLLGVELDDVKWERDRLRLTFAYSIAGLNDDVHTIHQCAIGVDGENFDKIWIDDKILPIDAWAGGKPVHIFELDGWKISGKFMTGSSDYFADGKGEAFIQSIDLKTYAPDQYALLLDSNGLMTLTSKVWVQDYATGDELECGTLTLCVSAPSVAEWQAACASYSTSRNTD